MLKKIFPCRKSKYKKNTSLPKSTRNKKKQRAEKSITIKKYFVAENSLTTNKIFPQWKVDQKVNFQIDPRQPQKIFLHWKRLKTEVCFMCARIFADFFSSSKFAVCSALVFFFCSERLTCGVIRFFCVPEEVFFFDHFR